MVKITDVDAPGHKSEEDIAVIKKNWVRFFFMNFESIVDPSGPVVIILATGSEVRRFKPGQGRWIFSEYKNYEYVFFRKGSKAVGPVS